MYAVLYTEHSVSKPGERQPIHWTKHHTQERETMVLLSERFTTSTYLHEDENTRKLSEKYT